MYDLDEIEITIEAMKSIIHIVFYGEREGHLVRSCEERSDDLVKHNIHSNSLFLHSSQVKHERQANGVQEPKYDPVTKKLTYNYKTVGGYTKNATSTLNYIANDLDNDWCYDRKGRWRLRVELRLR